MTTVEILEYEFNKSDVELKNKVQNGEKTKEQPRFFCSNCEHEIFLNMLYCDECGGEIDWPKKYNDVIPKKKD